MEALLGAQNAIQNLKPQMLIERIKTNESDIEGFLKDKGYKTFAVGLNLLAIHETDPFATMIKIT